MSIIFRETVTGAEGTWSAAAQLAPALKAGDVVALHGELGAGKTTFVQGLGYALGVREPMTSPTFTIANEYTVPLGHFIHMDLYRLSSPDELLALGFEQDVRDGALIAIEWPGRAGDVLPANTYHVRFELVENGAARQITVVQA